MGGARYLGYFQQKQQQTNWCWAAVTASLCVFYSRFTTQCLVVGRFFQGKNSRSCCEAPGDSACNQVQLTELALTSFKLLKEPIDAPISFTRVRGQIDLGRPVSCSIRWPSGGGHAVIIDGYIQGSAEEGDFVSVQDPGLSADAVCMIYSAFRSAYRGNGAWKLTCLTKPPA